MEPCEIDCSRFQIDSYRQIVRASVLLTSRSQPYVSHVGGRMNVMCRVSFARLTIAPTNRLS